MGMIGIALAMVLGGQAAADAPLQPTGKWTVEYADSMCVLSHDYGEGDARVTVGFRPWPMGASTELVLLTNDAHDGVQQGPAKVMLLPSRQQSEGTYISWKLPKVSRRITTMTIPQGDLINLPTSDAVTMTVGKNAEIKVAPKSAKAALSALGSCTDDLLRGWGIDPHERDAIATPAIASEEGDWIRADDYPHEAIAEGASGTTNILWTIALDGSVRDCRVVGSSGSPLLDQAACKAIARRGHYHSAIGKDGKPLVSHKTRRVRWVLPS